MPIDRFPIHHSSPIFWSYKLKSACAARHLLRMATTQFRGFFDDVIEYHITVSKKLVRDGKKIEVRKGAYRRQ